MKAIYLLTVAAFIFCIGNVNAQVPDWIWAHGGGGTTNDQGLSIITDATGNVYVAGDFSSNPYAVFDIDTLTNISGPDMFLAKYDVFGNLLWLRGAGGNSDDYVNDIYCDPAGNVYIAGSSNSASISFGGISLTGNGFHDIVIAKYDTSGNVIWAQNFGNAGDERAFDIKGIGGDIYITGNFDGATVSFGATTLSNSSTGSRDIFVTKLDTAANAVWAQSAGSSSNDFGNGVSVDATNNIYVTGNFVNTITFGSTTLTASGGTDIFLAKYDSSGSVMWAVRTGGTSSEMGIDLCNDMAGNVYLTGNFSSTNMVFASTNFSFGGGASDILILKYDSAGNEIWGRFAGGASSDIGYGICTDAAGNVCTVGQFNFSITFGSTTITTSGLLDIFIVKLDASGNLLWATPAGGSNSADIGFGIATDSNSSTYITGYFGSTSVSFGSSTLTNAGQNDVFIAKLDSSNTTSVVQIRPGGMSFYLAPNPASGEIKIIGSDISGVEIFNSIGERVYRNAVISGNNEATINISALGSGIYYARVFTRYGTSTEKFVRE
jgi:hypothetical protein